MTVIAATHQLEGLHDEFKLADAAGAELQVVLELATGHFTRNQRLHVTQ